MRSLTIDMAGDTNASDFIVALLTDEDCARQYGSITDLFDLGVDYHVAIEFKYDSFAGTFKYEVFSGNGNVSQGAGVVVVDYDEFTIQRVGNVVSLYKKTNATGATSVLLHYVISGVYQGNQLGDITPICMLNSQTQPIKLGSRSHFQKVSVGNLNSHKEKLRIEVNGHHHIELQAEEGKSNTFSNHFVAHNIMVPDHGTYTGKINIKCSQEFKWLLSLHNSGVYPTPAQSTGMKINKIELKRNRTPRTNIQTIDKNMTTALSLGSSGMMSDFYEAKNVTFEMSQQFQNIFGFTKGLYNDIVYIGDRGDILNEFNYIYDGEDADGDAIYTKKINWLEYGLLSEKVLGGSGDIDRLHVWIDEFMPSSQNAKTHIKEPSIMTIYADEDREDGKINYKQNDIIPIQMNNPPQVINQLTASIRYSDNSLVPNMYNETSILIDIT